MQSKNELCTLVNKPCRHCSREAIRYSRKCFDIRSRKEVWRENNILLGFFCNDTGKFISDIKTCQIHPFEQPQPVVVGQQKLLV